MFQDNIRIKAIWARQLRKDWEQANYIYFNNLLFPPLIGLIDSEKTLGRWQGGWKRRLSVSSYLIQNYPWEYVREVLHHEMAHQYVEEYLNVSDEPPHGETFRRVCANNCFNPSATDKVHSWLTSKSPKQPSTKEEKLFDKIQKLLALAQSSNEHEAQLAMERAHQFLLKYNISLQAADQKRRYFHKQIGIPGRSGPVKSIIASILMKYFFVDALWVSGYDQHENKEGKILEIYGTSYNLEMAEYVHDYLHNITEILWKEHKLDNNIKGNRHRRTFIYGLLNGFYDKLGKHASLADKDSKGLILKEDAQLKAYFKRKNPRTRAKKSYYSKTSNAIYNEGLVKGKGIVINKGIHESDSGKIQLLE